MKQKQTTKTGADLAHDWQSNCATAGFLLEASGVVT